VAGEGIMGTNSSRATRSRIPVDEARRRMDAEMTIGAIAGAIATGRLPPDDACAWARIAAYEARLLGGSSGPGS
jgi:hypothetical protein